MLILIKKKKFKMLEKLKVLFFSFKLSFNLLLFVMQNAKL